MRFVSVVGALLISAVPARLPAAEEAVKPNIVYILADDLGYGDVGCYNRESKIPTPNIDRLAKEGMRFTDAHSPSAVCTPTRYALLTGRYAWRTRLQRNVIGPFSQPLIDANRLTVAGLLREHGYATACIGKWHLGWDWPKPDAGGQRDFTRPIPGGPTTRGFDSYFGTDVPNYPPYCFIQNDRTVGIPSEAAPVGRDSFRNAGPMLPGWKLVNVLPGLQDRAVQHVEAAATGRKPFFLYLPLTSPHFPVVPSAEFKGTSKAGDYGDFVVQTDHVVGRVLDALERTGAAKNTLVIFTSDNGPEITGEVNPGVYDRLERHGHASMGTLRGAKRDAWEGGHRVPFIARWPGKIQPGASSAETICHVDLMATAAELVGARLPADAGVDSVSILPVLLGERRDRPIRAATVHHSAQGKFAIRQGPWVLILAPTGDDNGKRGEPPWFAKVRGYTPHTSLGELYNLAADPAQKSNLYEREPAKVRELAALLAKYVTEGRSTPGPRQNNDVEVIWDRRRRPRSESPKPTSHTAKTVEGWTIRVDDRLLKEPNAELGTRALRFLETKLADIKMVVPSGRVKTLQTVTIVLDLSHGDLGPMQYHPSAAWLKSNGYSTDLARCVHLPRAADVATKRNTSEQPWVILHELAHAYHDQVLGFDEPRIRQAYEKYKKSGRGDKTLLHDGRRVKHYALTNHKEFFAEMTESYFGVNDFFPFNRAELKESEPEIFELMAHVWESAPKHDRDPSGLPAARSLEQELLAEGPATLAKAAVKEGDPVRGSILFHQPFLACAKCHDPAGGQPRLGPDLARPTEKLSAEHLVESVLDPSKSIRKGYESVAVATVDGTTITGLLAEDGPEKLVLRDASRDFTPVTIAAKDIESRRASPVSLMPSGQANQLTTRQQFLDLARYLIEINEQGAARAAELRPQTMFSSTPAPLPTYENDLDHAGMIAGLDGASLRRGEEIYSRICANCHGTREQPGSMPTSLRFAEGQFKSGSDPFSLYRTLTHGFGLMPQQAWLVPQQKYDVIHYIRESYLKRFNAGQYFKVDDRYLSRLPKGQGRGPAPSAIRPWVVVDYGPSLNNTYEIGRDGTNFAYKGIAVRLDDGPGGVSRGRYWIVYDHDTMRAAAAWSGTEFIDWQGIHFDGRHQVHPHIAGQVQWMTPQGPGWADAKGGFDDPRLTGRDGRRYGPLPREWTHYRGQYRFGNKVILSYTVGTAEVLEMPGLSAAAPVPVFTRSFNIGPRDRNMVLQVARHPGAKTALTMRTERGGLVAVLGDASEASSRLVVGGVSPASAEMKWSAGPQGQLRLTVPAGKEPLKFTVWIAATDDESVVPRPEAAAIDLAPLTRGGAPHWSGLLRTTPTTGTDDGPFAVDVLTPPTTNPWSCQMRFSGLDFYPDGKRLAVCTWDGDVWLVSGIGGAKELTWQRIASGLFQPLGLKIVDGQVYVGCRDQIVILRDLDGDGETDFYENFNSDHQVTDHFHEFAMGLQSDADGNLYYAKAARHALRAVVPQHGTLLRVSKDGSRTDILATGFRAPNGVCVNPDGTFYLTDQEGHWIPKNRINHVKTGGFYGNTFGYHDLADTSDAAMELPLCWITNTFDRSPSELLWVPKKAWGPLGGSLLNLSYGYGKVFVVPHETVNGQQQGGMSPLPITQFPTGIMRGRFHTDGHLYLCGLFAWGGNQQQPGGLYRVRYTGQPLWVPLALQARRGEIAIRFSGKLDPNSVAGTANYTVTAWDLKRSAGYGSKHLNERKLAVESATLSTDGTTVVLALPDLQPTWGMEIAYSFKSKTGEVIRGSIHNSIYRLSE